MTFREIATNDYEEHLYLLSQLSDTGNITKNEYISRVTECIKNPLHHMYCIEYNKKINSGWNFIY